MRHKNVPAARTWQPNASFPEKMQLPSSFYCCVNVNVAVWDKDPDVAVTVSV